jgi:hypothetical protein
VDHLFWRVVFDYDETRVIFFRGSPNLATRILQLLSLAESSPYSGYQIADDRMALGDAASPRGSIRPQKGLC